MTKSASNQRTDFQPFDIYGDVDSIRTIFYGLTAFILAGLIGGIVINLSTHDSTSALLIASGIPFILASLRFTQRKNFEWAAVFLAIVLFSMLTIIAAQRLGIHRSATLVILQFSLWPAW